MSDTRASLERSLQLAGRRLSSATIAFHRRLASRLGLNDTDHKCLDILLREGPMSAGDLSAKGGYTSGAITGIVNRLASKGFVSRVTDPRDGRRVVLKADAEKTHALMWPHLQPMIQALSQRHASLSLAELETVDAYLQDCIQILESTAPAVESPEPKREAPRNPNSG